MRLVHKLIAAGVVITVMTGSLAWLNTAKEVGTVVASDIAEALDASGALDELEQYAKDSGYLSEDGSSIIIPTETITALLEAIEPYLEKIDLEEIEEKYGIDVEAILGGDFSSLDGVLSGTTIEISTEKLNELIEMAKSYASEE